MPIGRQFGDAIHRIAEPRQQTTAAIRDGMEAAQDPSTIRAGFSDGELQARATRGRWNDTFYYPANSHVNTRATRGRWPEDLPLEPLQPRVTRGRFDQADSDPSLDYRATRGRVT